MIWLRLARFVGTIRTGLMADLERNPQAVRQGAAAAAVVIITAAGMPAMAMRASDQREEAQASASAPIYGRYLSVEPEGPAVRAELVAYSTKGGYGARALAPIMGEPMDRRALTVAAEARLAGNARQESFETREKRCLAEAIYYEARGESYQGQRAVAEVVLNRTRSSHYPSTVCGVVYQGSKRGTGCQFSFTCDGSLNHKPKGAPWREANAIAADMTANGWDALTNRATHYHTVAVDPAWGARLVETTRIGAHIFYRFPSKKERLTIEAGLRAQAEAAERAEADAPAASNEEAGAEPVTTLSPEASNQIETAPVAEVLS